MSARKKARRRPKASPSIQQPSRSERVETERRRIFKAMAIIACCRYATASLLQDDDGGDFHGLHDSLGDALSAAHELLDEVELEDLA